MSPIATLRSVYDLARDRDVTLLAASFAYYAFVSLFPLALLVLAVGSFLGGDALAARIVEWGGSLLSESGERLLRSSLSASEGQTGAGIVGALVLAWSALKAFRGIDVAFMRIYGVERDESIVGQFVDGVLVVVLASGAAALMVGVGAALRYRDRLAVPNVELLGALVLFAGLVALFLPLYYVMPPVDVTLIEALPGAVVAAVGWGLLQALFQVYAAHANRYQAYGLLGAVLLFLTWLYLAGVLFFLGVTVNVVLEGRH